MSWEPKPVQLALQISLPNTRDDEADFDSKSEISEAYTYTGTASHLFDPHRIASKFADSWCGLKRLLTLITPAVSLQKRLALEEKRDVPPTAYLDGLRGAAAFAVFLCHLSYTTWDIGHTFMAGEPGKESENTCLLQLPIVRLFYSGPPMVSIFFIISGYALSYKPVKQMHNHDLTGLISTIASSALRRPFRLFLPCIASTMIVLLLTRLGLYKLTEDFANNMRGIHEDHYWTAPDTIAQFVDYIVKMLNFVNVFDWSIYNGSVDLDRHLWTIPVEFRCSLALFMTQILVAKMSIRNRMATVTLLIVYGTYCDRPDICPFWAGLILAELDLIRQRKTVLPSTEQAASPARPQSRKQTKMVAALCLLIGLYLASYPDLDGHLSPGYVLLTSWIPNRYHEKHRFWPNIGAVLIVYGVGRLDSMRAIFNTRLMQYLGKISFPLYVCHGFVIHTFGYFTMNWIWETTNALEDRPLFIKGYVLAAVCTIAMTIWISDMFLRLVDVRAVRFARWLEQQLFTP